MTKLSIKCLQTHILITEPIFTISRFGKPVIERGMYRYNRNNRSIGPRGFWTCTRNSKGCRATITTFDNVIIKENNTHNHF
ncbi:unnamed protein product [Leptidea sinapis]|uniref:FLYWCH-type domain-containing protein n=1 Tax=Leptidea sinapis TaxID=189913 RepID=A0A5E4PXB1_9NEOP|nr:unnamed protein product [Leptidea sinapis]